MAGTKRQIRHSSWNAVPTRVGHQEYAGGIPDRSGFIRTTLAPAQKSQSHGNHQGIFTLNISFRAAETVEWDSPRPGGAHPRSGVLALRHSREAATRSQ